MRARDRADERDRGADDRQGARQRARAARARHGARARRCSRSSSCASRTRRCPAAASSTSCRSRSRAGEVVALAGAMGAGPHRDAVGAVRLREAPASPATIRVDGSAVAICASPRAAIAAGLALVPEDRKAHGPRARRCRSPTTSRCPRSAGCRARHRRRRAGSSTARADARARARDQGAEPARRGRDAVRRQPAEGRDRQVARARAARAAARRADARRRRRREGRDLRAHRGARRARPRRRARVVAICPRSCASPTACSCCARAGSPASSPATRSPSSRSCSSPSASLSRGVRRMRFEKSSRPRARRARARPQRVGDGRRARRDVGVRSRCCPRPRGVFLTQGNLAHAARAELGAARRRPSA